MESFESYENTDVEEIEDLLHQLRGRPCQVLSGPLGKCLQLIDRTVPADLEIHLVADRYSTHKHDNVTTWLEHPSRRDRFTSVRQLTDSFELWTEHRNNDPRPFIWHKTAEEIITKVKRGRAALNQITESATDH